MAETPRHRNIVTWGLEQGIGATREEVLIQSYETAAFQLIAALQVAGPVDLPEDWIERAEGHVVLCDPLPDGRWRMRVAPRAELEAHLAQENQRAHELMEDL